MGALTLMEADSGDVPTPATGKASLFVNTSGDACVKLDDGSVVVIGSGGFIVDVTAGTGISATPQSAGVIEISNLGVLSLNGLTGVATLSAGAGITLTPQSGNAIEIAATGGAGGVSSLNGEQGALTLQPGANVTITPQSGGVFVIDATGGGVAAIEAGDGISIHELSGGVKQIAANLQAGANITITPVSGNALEIAATGGGGGVSSLNSMTGAVNIQAGSNVTVTPQSGNVIEISASGGGGDVVAGNGIAIDELSGGVKRVQINLVAGANVTLTELSGNALQVSVSGAAVNPTESMMIAVGDETTPITAGTNKIRWYLPYAFTVTEVRASLNTAQSSGGIVTVDINEGGSSILSTKITIDNNENTSVTAATPPVISDASLADNALMSIDIDQAGGTDGAGLKVYIIGYRT